MICSGTFLFCQMNEKKGVTKSPTKLLRNQKIYYAYMFDGITLVRRDTSVYSPKSSIASHKMKLILLPETTSLQQSPPVDPVKFFLDRLKSNVVEINGKIEYLCLQPTQKVPPHVFFLAFHCSFSLFPSVIIKIMARVQFKKLKD